MSWIFVSRVYGKSRQVRKLLFGRYCSASYYNRNANAKRAVNRQPGFRRGTRIAVEVICVCKECVQLICVFHGKKRGR